MTPVFEFSIFILICTLILTLFLILPLWFLVTGIKRKRNVRIVVATLWLAVSCSLALLAADSFSSRHERILDHGQTPDGHEYVLFQTCRGEPYEVELFVRNEQREWQFSTSITKSGPGVMAAMWSSARAKPASSAGTGSIEQSPWNHRQMPVDIPPP